MFVLFVLSFSPLDACSGSSGPTCCKQGEACSSPGTSGCCQDCGADLSCYCDAASICTACGNLGAVCHTEADCCDWACEGTCCVGKGEYGCRTDSDCCSGLSCQKHYNVFSCL